MKKVLLIILGIIIGVQVYAQEIPGFTLAGISFIDRTSATAVVSYIAQGDEYPWYVPGAKIFAEYTNTVTGETGITAYASLFRGTEAYNFRMDELQPGTRYSVVGVMLYGDTLYQTQPKFFTTVSKNTSNGTAGLPSLTSILPKFPTKSTIKERIMTGGVTTKNGVTIAITNEQARVDARDSFTYTIRYFNENKTSLENAKLDIVLPNYYEFRESRSDFVYDTKENSVELVIGRIAPESTRLITFDARALNGNSGQVETSATLTYEGGTLTAIDHDSFYGGAKNIFGVAVFGTGFLPQTLLGWVIIIIIITILMIIIRRYTKKVEEPEEEKKS